MHLKRFGEWGMVFLLSAASLTGADARLADATEKMDRASIRTLLQQDIDVNAPQIDGMTALHWAAYQDDQETVKLLVRSGAHLRAANRYGVTPLSLACTNGNGAMVEFLLEAGADPNATLRGGETALMTAARTGKFGAVKALLSRGADVHSKESRRGQTALMWAAAEGHEEVVDALIRAGAGFPRAFGFRIYTSVVRPTRRPGRRCKGPAGGGAEVNETTQPSERRGGYKGAAPGRHQRVAHGGSERSLRAGGLFAGRRRGSELRPAGVHGTARDCVGPQAGRRR